MASVRIAPCCVFLLICCCAACCRGADYAGDVEANAHQLVRRCGSRLVDTLKELCKNCFNGGNRFTSRLRRSIFYYPFLASGALETSKRNPKMAAAIRTTTNRGIIDECCIKQCTYNYLKSYCSDECDWIEKKPASKN